MSITIADEIRYMEDELTAALNSQRRTYKQARNIIVPGVYFVYRDDQVIYVGKTSREGKTRFQEMAADYRSPTLNRKLLLPILNEHLNTNYKRLTKDIKPQLIAGGIISQEEFQRLQREVNRIVKTELRFQFHSTKPEDLTRFEHFAISILNPPLND